jgi:hypothetical protein
VVDVRRRNPDNGVRRLAVTVRADHERLKLLAQRLFDRFEPYQVVTFLNQTLKERGLIFGVRLIDGHYELAVYDAREGADGPDVP